MTPGDPTATEDADTAASDHVATLDVGGDGDTDGDTGGDTGDARGGGDTLGVRIGPFELIRVLGRGGMGQVYLARDIRLGRLVALKLLLHHGRRGAARFIAESRATARLSHDNVVTIYEVGEHRGQPYMALEYLRGVTLRQWLEQRRPARDRKPGAAARTDLPARRIAELALPVARALVSAHDLGIVHRDLKPDNIMLTESGAVKVLDFGVAKLMSDARTAGDDAGARSRDDADATGAATPDPPGAPAALTEAGAIVGTTAYMSPEQWGAGDIDHRTDVWAVGVILHELALGAIPLADLPALDRAARLREVDDPMPSVSESHPELGELGQLIDRCLHKRKRDRLGSARELAAALEALARPGRDAVDGEHNPFAGLAAFEERDAERFFGRDRAIGQVVAQLVHRPMIAILGPSGAGKSSFVRAGLIPALRRSGDAWETFTVRPGARPLAGLSALLRSVAPPETAEIAEPAADADLGDRLRAEPGYLGAALRARARRERDDRGRPTRCLLFVDQLEELYTLAPAQDRRAFLACLAGVADDPSSPLRAIATIRADFLDRLSQDQDALPELARGLVLLPAMSRDELRAAIERPLALAGYQLDPPELAGDMLDELAHERGALPLLQFTASVLWDRRDRERRVITADSYRDSGGVAGALAAHADTVVQTMSSHERAIARAVLLRLVTRERTRAVVDVDELYALAPDQARGRDDVARVLDRLIEGRLVVVEGSAAGAVELVHESLIARWPTLAAWLHESSEDLAFVGRLGAAAREWAQAGGGEGTLWRGAAATEAARFADRYDGELTADERRYLDAVIALDRRVRRGRRRLVVGAFTALVAVALALAYLALRERSASHAADVAARHAEVEAEHAARQADNAREQAERARDATRIAAARQHQADPTIALALLREVERDDPLAGWAELVAFALHDGVATAVLEHPALVYAVAFSPDGTRLATGARDGAVRLWRTDLAGTAAEPIVLTGHERRVLRLAFSPDGTRLISGSGDGTARIWRVSGPGGDRGDPVVLAGHDALVCGVSFAPDGQRAITLTDRGAVRVWRLEAGGGVEIARFDVALGPECPVAVSPDGATIALADAGGVIRLFSLSELRTSRVIGRVAPDVRGLAFSPEGARLASAAGKIARVWRLDGRPPIVFDGHGDNVTDLVFSPDGARVVSSSRDRTARVWSADAGRELRALRGHENWLAAVAFDSTGTRVATASLDHTARLWNVDPASTPLVLDHGVGVNWAEPSPDGTRILSVTYDDALWIWPFDGAGEPRVLRAPGFEPRKAAWSPDGGRVAASASDGAIWVWDARAGAPIAVLRGHEDGATSVEFSRDGTRIVSASRDQTARVWRAPSVAPGGEPSSPGGALVVLRGHDGLVNWASFSPDGERIATASADRTARIWAASGEGEPIVLSGHEDRVIAVAWSPDGRRVVTGAYDKTARVWDVSGAVARGLVVLRGHDNWVTTVTFSPDGERIATASADGPIRVWRADGAGEPVVLRGHRNWVFAAEFTPDGERLVSASWDETARVWDRLTAFTPDDPALWSATSYCPSVEQRIQWLGMSDDRARARRQACLERVVRVR